MTMALLYFVLLQKHENISGNYYPVNSRILISRNEDLSQNGQSLVVLNDRSQGGTSMNDGEIELMVMALTKR